MDKHVEQRFLDELRHHLAGWKHKVLEDFCEQSFLAELNSLKQDPIYSRFHLHSPEYVVIRLMGRMSISIGRRLGEIYDKLPRFVAQARYRLTKSQIAPKLAGTLELDICIPFEALSVDDKNYVETLCLRHLNTTVPHGGLGIEIRYNFNPNDSSRLRKDVEMAKLLRARQLIPIYLIFAENSPREEAIARLRRAGWTFLIGTAALDFVSDLVGANINTLLDSPTVAAEIKREIEEMTAQIYTSFAFKTLPKR